MNRRVEKTNYACVQTICLHTGMQQRGVETNNMNILYQWENVTALLAIQNEW